MTTKPVYLMPVAWYKKEDYQRLKTIFDDGDQLHDRFEEWLHAAEQSIKLGTGKGYTVVQVNIDPDTFPEWCRSRGLNINSEARTKFINTIAAEQAKKAMNA
ncbi:hypothetical protein [Endozoicomonas acroporae]|uniref:hypothetical protein n=1 Tax=Endozoicomonas acroporae TaxID=1701104 RepID=UPI0013D3C3F0|nr:hypothetical protein [Endozoicomonas acroporae]